MNTCRLAIVCTLYNAVVERYYSLNGWTQVRQHATCSCAARANTKHTYTRTHTQVRTLARTQHICYASTHLDIWCHVCNSRFHPGCWCQLHPRRYFPRVRTPESGDAYLHRMCHYTHPKTSMRPRFLPLWARTIHVLMR